MFAAAIALTIASPVAAQRYLTLLFGARHHEGGFQKSLWLSISLPHW
jgi:hypothetical protein